MNRCVDSYRFFYENRSIFIVFLSCFLDVRVDHACRRLTRYDLTSPNKNIHKNWPSKKDAMESYPSIPCLFLVRFCYIFNWRVSPPFRIQCLNCVLWPELFVVRPSEIARNDTEFCARREVLLPSVVKVYQHSMKKGEVEMVYIECRLTRRLKVATGITLRALPHLNRKRQKRRNGNLTKFPLSFWSFSC